VTTYRLQSFSFHLVGLGEISSSNLFADLHTYIQTVWKKDGVQGEISSLKPRPGADHIWGDRMCVSQHASDGQFERNGDA
jgi:hypothetical protein